MVKFINIIDEFLETFFSNKDWFYFWISFLSKFIDTISFPTNIYYSFFINYFLKFGIKSSTNKKLEIASLKADLCINGFSVIQSLKINEFLYI